MSPAISPVYYRLHPDQTWYSPGRTPIVPPDSIFDPLYPSLSLYPSTTLYPGGDEEEG